MIVETIILSATAAIIIAITQVIRLQRTRALHDTIQEAIRTGSPLAEELLAKLARSEDTGVGGRWGWIFIAVAAATVAFGLIQGDADDIKNLAGIALFPGLIGVVLIVLSLSRGGKR